MNFSTARYWSRGRVSNTGFQYRAVLKFMLPHRTGSRLPLMSRSRPVNPTMIIMSTQVVFQVGLFESGPLKNRQAGSSFQVLILPWNRGIDNHFRLADETSIHQLSGAGYGVVSVGFDFRDDVN